jgi:phage tail tape-measure protein
MGQRIGAGLGAIAGGFAGSPAGPLGIAKGAAEGALLGGSAGGLAGGMIQPGRPDTQQTTQQTTQQGGVSLVQTAAQSQQLLSGINSLEFLDETTQQELSQPLTQAYIASMVQLKNRERGMS